MPPRCCAVVPFSPELRHTSCLLTYRVLICRKLTPKGMQNITSPAGSRLTCSASNKNAPRETLRNKLEQSGLSELKAEKVAADLEGTSSLYAKPNYLLGKIEILQMLLPGVDILDLIFHEGIDILDADPAAIATRLIFLKEALNCRAPVQLAVAAPQLLTVDDIQGRVANALEMLHRFFPSRSLSTLQRIIVSAPTVVFRFDLCGNVDPDNVPNDIKELVSETVGWKGQR